MPNPASSRTNYPTVPDGAARSVAGPIGGLADATLSTTNETFDLSDVAGDGTIRTWEGFYIELHSDVDCLFVFSDDDTDTITTGAAATFTDTVPALLPANTPVHVVVPGGKPILIYRTVSASSGTIRVRRS